jgi:hypothetical protein
MKKQKYKHSVTWWVGWWASAPVRLFMGLFFVIPYVIDPSFFYGFMNAPLSEDQSKWRL